MLVISDRNPVYYEPSRQLEYFFHPNMAKGRIHSTPVTNSSMLLPYCSTFKVFVGKVRKTCFFKKRVLHKIHLGILWARPLPTTLHLSPLAPKLSALHVVHICDNSTLPANVMETMYQKQLRFITTVLACTAMLATVACTAQANPGRIPGPAIVGLARADHVYLPDSIFTLRSAYPEGKIDYEVLELLFRRAVTAFSGQQPDDFWTQNFLPNERVGLMIDVQEPPVPPIMVEAIIRQLVSSGSKPENILIFACDERDVFAAGFSLDHDRPGVKAYGAASLGYRNGISRILIDMCDKIINVAMLRPDSQLGMTGAVYNHLACAPATVARQVTADPQQLASVAARPLINQKIVLHFLVALHPFYALPTEAQPEPRWEYAGLLLASDPVAVDSVGLDILTAKRTEEDIEPAEAPVARQYLEAAYNEYRLGQADLDNITVVTVGPETE